MDKGKEGERAQNVWRPRVSKGRQRMASIETVESRVNDELVAGEEEQNEEKGLTESCTAGHVQNRAAKEERSSGRALLPRDMSEKDCTHLLRGLKMVPDATGATVEARRPRVEAMPDPEPRYGLSRESKSACSSC